MKKKFTLLITVTALLLGGSSGKVWGQTHFEHGEKYFNSTFSVENNYGPGESGTLTPNAGLSTNTGRWAMPSTSQGFAATTDGIITVGNTSNVVTHRWVNNQAIDESGSVSACVGSISICGPYSYSGGSWNWNNTQYCDGYSWTTKAEVYKPVVPDGTGVLSSTATYTNATVITVNGTANTYVQPWELAQLYFMKNEWYYHQYQLDKVNTYNHSVTVTVSGNDCSSWPGPYADSESWSDSDSHQGITWQEWLDKLGGEVPGWIVLTGGSHVNVTGAKGVSSGNNSSGTKTYLHLPSSPYSLMIDTKFDQASIKAYGAVDLSGTGTVADGRTAGSSTATLASDNVLTTNAVLGIHNAFIGDGLQTNTAGGTLLLGPNTTGQAQMVINTPGGTGSITQTFTPTGLVTTTAYGNTHYQNNVVSVGNYGNDGLGLDAPSMFSTTTTGTSGLQIFNHTTSAPCINLIFKANAPWTFGITSGNLLITSKNNLDFGTASTSDPSTITTTGNGHTTIRGGNRVAFVDGTHTYNGSQAGDYWVNAVAASGTTYCGVGDILSMAAAPVIAKNVGGTGNLKWQAYRKIKTEARVEFISDSSTDVDWIAQTDSIITQDTVIFTNDASATGYTKWTAAKSIQTSSNESPLTADNGVTFTHNGSGLTQWQAGDNIHTQNIINFERTANSSGKTRWWAGKNIFTEKDVTFISRGTNNDSIYWRADDGNIETGYNNGNGRIDFQNLDGSAANSHTKWHAYNNIITHAHVNFYNNTASSNTMWQTDVQDIITNDSVTFINEKAGNTDWEAYRNIFTYDTVEFTNKGTGYTKWDAETGNISTNRPGGAGPTATENGFVTFNNTNTGITEWEAALNIFTNNVVTFNNTITNTTTPSYAGYIKWWAQGRNIELNDSTIFNQLPTVNAPYGTLRGLNHNAGIDNIALQASIPAASLWLIANDSILSERKSTPLNSPSGRNEEPLLINFNADNNAPIMLHAVNGDVTLDGVLHIDRQNTGQSETTIEAGQDIHFLDTVTLFDPSNADILLHAHRDILTNMEGCSDNKTAPVTFEVTSNALTRWIADRNIHTRDTMNFKYNATTKSVLDLHLVARGGNIKTERWFNIDYDSDNKILFSAVDDVYPYSYTDPAFGAPGTGKVNNSISGPVGRFIDNGNIWFNDSIKITRTNAGAGITEILAKYNIRTAMFDYMDSLSNANNTTIESYKGDIFLGYSTEPDMCANPSPSSSVLGNSFDYDTTRFKYTVLNTNHNGLLDIKAGFEDAIDNNNVYDGGNIFFTHIDKYAVKSATSATKITIPFSNEYFCGSSWSPDNLYQLGNGGIGATNFTQSRIHYEHAGIIGGLGPCGEDLYSGSYDPMEGPITNTARDTSLIYVGNQGNLLVDAGLRGNIIMNRGGYLNFQDDSGNTEFRTRWGNIDMRYPFNADSLRGSLLFLASSDLLNKLKVSGCGCDEERNNIYLQDFKYNPVVNSGSIFVGADNNIKLQYGGLKTIGTERDPFFSPNNNQGYPCGEQYHCDSDTSENLARELILNFASDKFNAPITSGGFAAVASDLIDVYKNMVYNGGQGSGMSSVPGYGNLHGENVAGYGLYIKTQANKSNWGRNALDAAMTACIPEKCDDPCNFPKSVLQNTARVTFHSDARIYTENQRTYIGSPVLETYGNLDLNTHDKKGGKTSIAIQTDSLIVHDSLIIDGKLTKFTTWSGLYRDMPIFKLGHHRFTPPSSEEGCKDCFIHQKGTGNKANRTSLDTLYVTFRNGASVPRLHTLVADHTVLSFLTDSFDHVKGDPTINAKFYTDTFKVRNHVELYTDAKHEHDGHFELISEAQMDSKDYAGIYSRHLHMEPIAPTCADNFPYSQLWLNDPALDVITTSTFGGYGWIHADVHVEIEATLAPGFASLREKGNYCYELKAGTLRMQDLRLDKGAQLRYTIGDVEGFDGEKVDLIEVDEITMYGPVDIIVEKRCGQRFESGCYPIIRYNSVAIDTVNLNNLTLATKKIDGYKLSLDTSIPGTVYLCVGDITLPEILRQVYIPQTDGVTTNPGYGAYYVASMDNFKFTAKYTTPEPLKVVTNRLADDGKEEELFGTLNANGEYEYVVRRIQQNIVLKFGPDYASVDNAPIDGRVVWSYNNTIYFRVEKEDIASIYSIAGQLVKRIELPEGDYSVPMERGVYIVTLKDGSVHKVILK